ncbi:MAG: 3-deoxy-D-manno-octulosonic acid transferase, partial [Planctomycetes bacterium]|nr:3-deoxy-D-manno-octulosonic acid transferase [Planctomycetota bacterium]
KLWGEEHRLFYFPWDFSWAVGRAFRRLRPRVCVMMEGEVWPNFTSIAKRRGAAVVVANGRVGGNKGWPRYRRFASLVRGMFGRLSLVLAQDEIAAERFRYLGVAKDRVQVVGSLKYDTAEVVDQVAGAEALAAVLSLSNGSPVWVAGSTGPGEEAIVLESYGQLRKEKGLKGLRLVIVPRKPERFEEVGQLIASWGYRLLRYSQVHSGDELGEGADEAVILVDTMGDLRKFYSLADVVFVGRSLVPMGGSDMMEVAALGKAVVAGPYTENFMEAVRLLMAEKAIEVVADGKQLKKIVQKLLLDPKAATAMGLRGREVIVKNQGATRRSVEAIARLIADA